MIKLLRVLLLLVLPAAAFGQAIENVKAVTQGDKVVITFDVTNVKQGNNLNIQIYSSHNGFTVPLTYVTGDVGPNVKPGVGKRAEWEAASELKSFSGDVTFEVHGEMIAAWMFKNVSTMKKGKNTTIQWQGGSSADNIRLELVNGSQVVNIGEGRNTGTYNWTVPKDAATSSDYRLRLTSGGNVITSDPFAIKKKMSPLFIILPIAAVGGAAAALGGGSGKGGGGGGTSGGSDLPAPPTPTP